jgi:hypothetical protein
LLSGNFILKPAISQLQSVCFLELVEFMRAFGVLTTQLGSGGRSA